MQYIRLIIDNEDIDLQDFEGLPLSFIFRISNPSSGTSIAGSGGKRTIKIPATKENLAFFQNWQDTQSVANNATKLKPYQLQINGTPALSGSAQLQSAKTKGGYYKRRARNLSLALYGSNTDWIQRISGLRLRDLDFSDVNTVFNTTAVVQGMQASITGGDGRGFALVKWKEWNTPGEVDVSEYTPFLFIHTILTKIFDSVGYDIDSNFIDSELFKSLILLTPVGETYEPQLSKDYMNVIAQLDTPIVLNVVGPSIEITTIVYDNQTLTPGLSDPYDEGTGLYTAPFTGFYDIDFSYAVTQINAAGAINGATIEIFVNGVFAVDTQEFFSPNPVPPFTVEGTRVIFAEQGDIIEVRALIATLSGTTQYTIGGGSLKITGQAKGGFGSPLLFQYLLRDWTAADFILGLTDIYNLRFETDTDLQRVSVEPRNNYVYRERASSLQELREGFYLASQQDITNKLDLAQESDIKADNSIEDTFQYSFQSDSITENTIEENDGLPIYTAIYNMQQNRFKKAVKDIVVRFFSKTIHTNDQEINASGGVAPQIPLIYPQDYIENPTAAVPIYNVAPRIMHFFGQRGLDGEIVLTGAAGPNAGPIQVTACFFVNYADITGLDPSLSFARENLRDGATAAGLLENYFLQELVTLDFGRRVQEFFKWTTQDVIGLTLRQMRTVLDTEFVLEEINGYNPLNNKSTKTKLLENITPTEDDVDSIIDTSAVGVANLIDNGE